MTVIAQDDHLTVGAWATCGPSELKAWEQVYRKEKNGGLRLRRKFQ